MDDIPTLFTLNETENDEHQQYLAYFNLWKEMIRENNSITNVDSVQLQSLVNIMNNSSGLISTYARNILITNGMVVYKEQYIFPEEGLKSSKILQKISSENYKINMMKVYPNPAKDYIIVEFTLNESPKNVKVELYDALGKNLRRLEMENTHDWLVIPLQDVPGGTYICCLKIENKPVCSVKFILTK